MGSSKEFRCENQKIETEEKLVEEEWEGKGVEERRGGDWRREEKRKEARRGEKKRGREGEGKGREGRLSKCE